MYISKLCSDIQILKTIKNFEFIGKVVQKTCIESTKNVKFMQVPKIYKFSKN